MLSTLKRSLIGQYEAALATLGLCMDACPEEAWAGRVCNLSFRHVAFHTLFFTDLYLNGSEERFKSQPFHREHPDLFNGYQELGYDSAQSTADRETLREYHAHCLEVARVRIEAETSASLEAPSEFTRLGISRLEHHVYNIRHIQHHAAQLSLRLRLDGVAELGWVKSGTHD